MENEKIYTAAALGFFDGVHLGHQSIIKETLKYQAQNIIPIVYTFKNSPKENNINLESYSYLTENEEKTRLLLNYGIKRVYMDNFTDIKNLSCEEFIKEVIKKKLNAKYVICGENYSFGYKAQGDCKKLKYICTKYNIYTKVVPLKTYKDEYISSTRIRKMIKLGILEDAEKMLGRKFNIHNF